MSVNRESAMNRGWRARSASPWLLLVALVGCARLGPTPDPPPSEALGAASLALTTALTWTSFATEPRGAYAGVELGDGSVLVCGGSNTKATAGHYVLTCNRLSFDTTLHSQSFSLPEGRGAATLTLLPPDRVLLAGGADSTNQPLTSRLSSPISSWVDGGTIWGMPEGPTRVDHTASRLDSSVVLIGGAVRGQQLTTIDVRSDQGEWTKADLTSSLVARVSHTATVLKGQPGSPARVLILGGYGQVQGDILSSGFTFSLPNTITPIHDMPEARMAHTATLLDDGSVLVVGGQGRSGYLGTASRYYPETDTWLSAGSTVPRTLHAAARLGTSVIVAGGITDSSGSLAVLGGEDDALRNSHTVDRFDPATNAWSRAPNLRHGRKEFQLFALDQNHLVAVGGEDEFGTLATSEVFTAGVLGDASSDANSCVSGHVADGVCCDSDCGGPCHSCNDPRALGTCRELVNETPTDPDKRCINHLQCSAVGCADRCSETSPCEPGYFCTSDGTCEAAKGIGIQCSASAECAAGAPCVDGVCCESACSGSCEACNQPHLLGHCLPLPEGAAPRDGHPSCPDAQDPASTCGASCDGQTTDRCVFPSGSPCGAASCSSDSFQPAGQCDEQGACVSPSMMTCAPYACEPGGCRTECRDNQDCLGTSRCKDGVCHECNESECNTTGYRCDPQLAECRNTCTKSATDCAGGYYCHPSEHRCVESVKFPAASLPACGIGHEPVRSRDATVALASLLSALVIRSKRRAKRRCLLRAPGSKAH